MLQVAAVALAIIEAYDQDQYAMHEWREGRPERLSDGMYTDGKNQRRIENLLKEL